MGDFAGNAFEFYDGVRILLTGAIVTAIYTAIIETFALHAPLPTSDTLSALTAVVLSGLFMYFIDVAGRSVIYSARLPHEELGSWGLSTPVGVSIKNAYFVLMDTRMPAGLRNRAQYYGSIFKTGYDTTILLGLSATVAFGAAELTIYRHGAAATDRAHPVIVAATVVIALLAAAAVAAAYVRVRVGEGQSRWRVMRVSLAHQIPWTDWAVIVLMAAGAAVYALWGFRPALIATGILANSLWVFRYLRGTLNKDQRGKRLSLLNRSGNRVRRNIEGETAALLLCLGALSIWIPSCLCTASGTHLDSAATVGWSLTLVAAGLLMLSKGHEGKLWASRYTVIAWLRVHKAVIVAELGLTDPAHESAPDGTVSGG